MNENVDFCLIFFVGSVPLQFAFSLMLLYFVRGFFEKHGIFFLMLFMCTHGEVICNLFEIF